MKSLHDVLVKKIVSVNEILEFTTKSKMFYCTLDYIDGSQIIIIIKYSQVE